MDCVSVFRQHLNNSMNIVWFNGPSAKVLHTIPLQQLEIGCNFIEKHRPVHHVCAYDRQVLEAIKPKADVQYWTRRVMSQPNFKHVEYKHEIFCSGTLAMSLARQLQLDHVYIIGCDWQHTNASVYDNLYTWRNFQPKKNSIPRRKLLERMHTQMPITVVTDRPWKMSTDFISTKKFLKMIN